MNNKRLCIFGSDGMLGSYFKNIFKNFNLNCLIRKDFDILKDNLFKLINIIDTINPDIIINCVGLIPQREPLNNTKKYILVNSIFPIHLSNICQKLKIKFIHISTDCVYSGAKGNYYESDLHDETNIYGISKSLGENINYGTIIRTSIIGEEINNKKSLLEWVKSNKNGEINGYANNYWNGITCLELGEYIEFMIRNNKYWNGVRHIYSPEIVSKFELCEMINKIYNLNIKILKNSNNKIDKTLKTKYKFLKKINNLETQIINLKNFKLLN